MNYICIKLVTGEELVGTIESEPDEYVNIENPIEVSFGFDAEGNYGIKLGMFMSYCEEKLFTFKARDIILYNKPGEKMIRYYEEFLKRYTSPEEDEPDMDSFSIKSFSIH